MELRHLRYFVVVAETENVSKAALRLHVSQPSLSRQVRDLEEELGFSLLERRAKSVRLTEAGRVFLMEAREMLARVESGVQRARAAALGGGGVLHIGYAPTLTARILPPALKAMQVAMPRVELKLHDASTREMLVGLRDGSLQIAITVRPSGSALRGLRFEPCATESLRLAVSPTHPLARKQEVALGSLARQRILGYNRQDYPEYHDMLEKLFGGMKPMPRVVEEHDGVSSLISAVAASDGVAIVPHSLDCIAGQRLSLLRLVPEPEPLGIGVLITKDHPTEAATQFVELVLREVGNVGESVPVKRVRD